MSFSGVSFIFARGETESFRCFMLSRAEKQKKTKTRLSYAIDRSERSLRLVLGLADIGEDALPHEVLGGEPRRKRGAWTFPGWGRGVNFLFFLLEGSPESALCLIGKPKGDGVARCYSDSITPVPSKLRRSLFPQVPPVLTPCRGDHNKSAYRDVKGKASLALSCHRLQNPSPLLPPPHFI